MVSLRKLLRLDITTAGLSTRMRIVSKEIAAGTLTVMATLQDSSDNERVNSDAGSSYGESAAEPPGRESRDEMESEETLA